ncbi:MAG TPA: hypothetical protein VNG31_08690 [Candidatus Baltobacteraceae bacterium]|nr:hypothetical protein [Candidatus Baltobacteraceae bacterium]
MMTRQLDVSILSAPLAAIDRRVLSQAWYSALALARDTRAAARAQKPAVCADPAEAAAKTVASEFPRARRAPGAARVALRPAAEPERRAEDGVERRAARSSLARDIERIFCRARTQPKRATFTIGGGARVHVVLQTVGRRVRLVAICAPRLKGAVSAALSQARFLLARRGIGVDLTMQGENTCF